MVKDSVFTKFTAMFAKKSVDETDARKIAVFGMLKKYKINHNGNSPSFQQIINLCDSDGIKSKSSVAKVLALLEEDGIVSQPGGSRAIEIVGGKFVVGKVCEWRKWSSPALSYDTSCGKHFFGTHIEYKYCPYCSLEIVVTNDA